MMKTNNRTRYRVISSITVYLFTLLLLSVTAAHANSRGKDGVSAFYTNKKNGLVVLQLRITNPGPESIIVEQLIPAGSSVVSASPKPKKIGSKSGKIKWLLKNVSPGTRKITMQLSPKESSLSVQAIIRFRKPGKGLVEKIVH